MPDPNPVQVRGPLQCGPDVFDVVLNQLRLAVCSKLYGGVSQQVKEGLVDCVYHEVHVARSGVLPAVEKCLQQRRFILGEPQGVAAITGGPKGILRARRRDGLPLLLRPQFCSRALCGEAV